MFKKYSAANMRKKAGKKSDSKTKQKNLEAIEKSGEEALSHIELSSSIAENRINLQSVFEDCSDVIFREFVIGTGKVTCIAVYIDGITKKEEINESLLKPIMTAAKSADLKELASGGTMVEYLKNTSVYLGEVEESDSFKQVVTDVLNGYCAIFIDGYKMVLLCGIKSIPSRSVAESKIEQVVRGPYEGFNENIQTNTALIRKRVKTTDFKMEKLEVGRISKTDVIIAYIKNIAQEGAVNEVRQRLEKIDIDMIAGSGQIEQLMEDDTYSPLPQIEVTERPDVCASSLANGRIVILVDGTPHCLIVPAVFSDFFKSPEDTYSRFSFASFSRLLRYLAFLVALLLPSFYVAVTTYHQEMIPTPLLVSFVTTRASLPFPAVFEALLMEITFEILREAGLRLPLPVGQSVSIVGALVIGETAVSAGLVSHEMVIVVALTGIASFTIPRFDFARGVRLLRFPLMLLGSSLGIFGIILGLLLLLTHLSALRSLGVPYLSPITPLSLGDWRDNYIRAPIWMLDRRPSYIQKNNLQRQKEKSRPVPPESK